MNKFLKTAAVAAIAAVGLQAQAATILVDDFTVLQSLFLVTTGNVGSNAGINSMNASVLDTSVGCQHIIGCYRDVVVENNLPSSIGNASAEVRVNPTTTALNLLTGPNELSFNVDTGSKARATVTWDGDATSGNFATGFDKDFSSQQGLQFWVKSDGGVGGNQLVQITLKDTSNRTSNFLFQAFNTNIPGNVDLYILGTALFGGDFAEDAGFDYAHIAGIQAVVNLDGTTDSLDFALRLVNTIPEPGSLALGGLALLGLGAARRRKNS